MSLRYAALVVMWLSALLISCGQPSGGGNAGGSAASAIASATGPGESKPAGGRLKKSRRAQLPLLGSDQRRVALFVLPGDASVEVDGKLVERRDGVIDIVGKLGEKHNVRVFKGDTSIEETSVTIEESGASPATVDLNEALAASRNAKKNQDVVFGYDD